MGEASTEQLYIKRWIKYTKSRKLWSYFEELAGQNR